jgi:peptidoglycan hydrolase CwlO-like protein
MYMGGRDDTLASCPILFWHGITWLILVSIFAISAWAASLYVMPLVEKAHRIADEGYALITKANTKFELVDEIEEQVQELDAIIPTIKSTVVKMNEKLDEFAPKLQATVTNIDSSIKDINKEVLLVRIVASKTKNLVDDANMGLGIMMSVTVFANATLHEVQLQARELNLMLVEVNKTLQELRASQNNLNSAQQMNGVTQPDA